MILPRWDNRLLSIGNPIAIQPSIQTTAQSPKKFGIYIIRQQEKHLTSPAQEQTFKVRQRIYGM
jgi:hypothetical protein